MVLLNVPQELPKFKSSRGTFMLVVIGMGCAKNPRHRHVKSRYKLVDVYAPLGVEDDTADVGFVDCTQVVI